MNVQCPQCGKHILLSENGKQSLRQLERGKKARLKCAQCSTLVLIDAAALQVVPAVSQAKQAGGVRPPGPPDVSWLKEVAADTNEIVEETPRALLLIPPGKNYDLVAATATELGYQPETAATPEEAVEKIEFISYASIFLHCAFEPEPLESGIFYRCISSMGMNKRRYIFLTLIGEHLHTMYELEAVTCSANLTVKESDLVHLLPIMRKAIPEYEALFGPYMEELQVRGK